MQSAMENSTLRWDWKAELWEALAYRKLRTLRLDNTIQEELWSKGKEVNGKEVGAKDGAWDSYSVGRGKRHQQRK